MHRLLSSSTFNTILEVSIHILHYTISINFAWYFNDCTSCNSVVVAKVVRTRVQSHTVSPAPHSICSLLVVTPSSSPPPKGVRQKTSDLLSYQLLLNSAVVEVRAASGLMCCCIAGGERGEDTGTHTAN